MAYQHFLGYLMPKPFSEKNWYYLTHSWEDKGVHIFPKGICPKVNVIAWLEYELAYYDSAVHRFNHYTTRTPPLGFYSETEHDRATELRNHSLWGCSQAL